ncbi:hypothetical protein H4R18_005013 [Coemansia javaensis]|uniref:Pentacotripeptide-repeat region of PRORP domain-containing protein n=1 Tax=Coemansia javaensis TaxID=2761396 RepID=A0A9W8LEZ1_9FUNG|nr:hypothetical protein H4R18_005013 [Coemansia javaensis]
MLTQRAALAALRAAGRLRPATRSHGAAHTVQQRSLSEIYTTKVAKKPEAKSPETQTPAAKDQGGKARPVSCAISSIPEPRAEGAGTTEKHRSAEKGASARDPKPAARAPKPAAARDPKSIAGDYILQLHKSDWSDEETWVRFCDLPRAALCHLRDIDVNCTLARIRGTRRTPGRAGATTATLRRMLRVYEEARRAGIVPDRYTYQELIAINVDLLNFEYAREWIEKMVQQGIAPTIRPYRTLLKGYSLVAGEIEGARRTWREIKAKVEGGLLAPETAGEAAPALDLATYTCIISAEARAGHFDRAVGLLDEMAAAGVKADIALRNAILGALLKYRGLDAGLTEATLMEESGFELDGHTYALLLGAACSEQRVDEARRLLGAAADRGIVPPSHIIQSLPLDALEILDAMAALPAERRVRLYNVLVEAAMRRNSFDKVLQLTDHMRGCGVAANTVTYAMLLDALNKAGRLEQAKAMFNRLLDGGEVELDVHIFGIMIDACGRNGDVRGMFLLKGEMRRRGLAATESVYNSILSALARWRQDNLQAVMAVAGELDRSRTQVAPTARTFSAIFAAFVAQARRRKLGDGELRFLQTWYGYAGSKYYVARDGYFYFMAVRAFLAAGRLADAMAAFGDMARQAELDPSAAGKFAEKPRALLDLMQLAVERQEFEAALEVWRRWLPLGLPPMPAATNMALFAYDQTGRIQAAQDMVRALLVRQDAPDPLAFCPGAVTEHVLAMYIAMLVKHGRLDAVVPALRQWTEAAQPASAESGAGVRPASHRLTERTVSKLSLALQKSRHPDAAKTRAEALAFVDRHFPEAVPV